ncbi:MAG: hypothetical protein V1902_03245 [Candidatus Falkowbacteria bacterium]
MGRDWSTPELRALKRMRWLIDMVVADEDAITDEQLVRFGKSPDCIIPACVVSVRRIPLEYGQISNPMVSDEGEFAFLAKNKEGVPVAVVGGHVTRIGSRSDGQPDLSVRKLVGVVNGSPLWIDTHAFMVEDLAQGDWNNRAMWRLRLGKKVVFETEGVTAFLPLKDGSYVYCVRQQEEGLHSVLKFKNGKHEPLIVRCPHPIHRFVETNDGSIWFFWLEDKVPMCARIEKNLATLFPDADYNAAAWITDVIDTEGGVRFVLQAVDHEFDMGIFEQAVGEIFLHCYESFMDDVVYVGRLTRLSRDKFAYVGKARHNKQRWVVGGIPQPAMDWVGPLCEDTDSSLSYMALCGRHLLTMQIPD